MKYKQYQVSSVTSLLVVSGYKYPSRWTAATVCPKFFLLSLLHWEVNLDIVNPLWIKLAQLQKEDSKFGR